MQQDGSKYVACSPPPTLTIGVGLIGQKSTFPEHGHVAYQIEYNHECSSMAAYIFPADLYPTPTTWGRGNKVKIELFQNLAMLHIKRIRNH